LPPLDPLYALAWQTLFDAVIRSHNSNCEW